MTKWRLAPSLSALGCVANTFATQLGPFAAFTTMMQTSTSNNSYNSGGAVNYNLHLQGQPVQPLPQAFPCAYSAPAFVPAKEPPPHPFAFSSCQSSSDPTTVQDLKIVLIVTQKDLLPQWKLAQYNGDPLKWYEWIGQFRSAVNSQNLSDDVNLTNLKTLVTGKAKTALAQLSYSDAR